MKISALNWIDCHNHLHFPEPGERGSLLAAMRSAGVVACVVNATCEEEWKAVAGLAVECPEQVMPMFGIHPWRTGEAADVREGVNSVEAGAHRARKPDANDSWQARLQSMLERFPQAGVGECGLDGCVKTPGLGLQRPVFLDQLRIAREMQRSVTIHCVKAWGPLFEAFAMEAPPPRFLMHAFAGSLETARRLVPLGAYFSFSGAFLQPRRASVLDVFRQLPRQRILIETDAPEKPKPESANPPLPENPNLLATLPIIACGLARALGMSLAELAELTHHNARECFGRSF